MKTKFKFASIESSQLHAVKGGNGNPPKAKGETTSTTIILLDK
ncbi:MAG: hypothetical protein AAFV95_10675 [Bacteroidota bacterium]